MGLNPLTLSFPGELEKEYSESAFHKALPQVRMAIILGGVLYCLFGILDALLLPEMKAVFWTLRFGVALPAIIGVFIFTYSPHYRNHLQTTMTGLMILSSQIIIAMIVLATPPINFSYYAGLILTFMWGYTFIRVRFIWATLAAWFVVFCYEAAAIFTGTPLNILINNNFFFISANIIGMFACYSIEYYQRRDFYITRLLAIEKEKVKEANLFLENKVQIRTAELEVSNEELIREMAERTRMEGEKKELEERLILSEKMQAIGRLAGGVAHDLNNVLNAIVAYPDLLLMSLPEDSPQRRHLLTIQRSGLKAAAIVRDLLTLARRGVAVKEVISVNELVSEYLSSAECDRLMVYHPDIRLQKDLQPGVWNIEGSPIHIAKTIMNLVSNAAEAMTSGGEILISTFNRSLSVSREGHEASLKEGDYVVLQVSDSGIGITEEDRKKIFEPFYSKKVMGRSGTGLGMAVVWGTVEDHHGSIDVQSTPDEGTTFTLYFPRTVKLRELDGDEEGPGSDEFKGSGEKILVVDDVEEQRDIARELLRRLHYSVVTVPSGEAAVRYMKEHEVDLVVLDMIMDPGIDGLDTYRQILGVRPGMRAIIASGFSETERARETIKLGAGEYIMKPYTLRKIGAAVKAELGRNYR